jgi:serine/threonine-protein kinase
MLRRVQHGDFAKPRQLVPSTDPPLEAICMKAMALTPQDRYASARSLADDVERWMADEPVSACRDPLLVRLARYSRKHRTLLATAVAVLIVAALAAGLVASQQTAFARDIGRKNTELTNANRALDLERKKAEEREEMAIDAVKRFGDAVSKNPALKNNRGLESLRKELLREPLNFLKTLRDQLQSSRDTQTKSLGRLASAAFDLALLTAEIGDKQDALRALEESLALWERLARKNPTAADVQSRWAKAYHNIGVLQGDSGHPEHALASLGRALEIQERLATANPSVKEYQSDLGRHHHSIGLLQSAMGHPEEALASYGRALEIRQRLARENPNVTEYQNNLAKTHNNIGGVEYEAGHPDEALASYRAALRIEQRLARANPTVTEYQSDLAKHLGNIAILEHDTGHTEEALASLRSAIEIQERLAHDYPSVTEYQQDLAMSHDNIAHLESQLGHSEQALPQYRRALDILERLVREHPTETGYQSAVADTHNNLGLLEQGEGRSERALASFRAALAILERLAQEHAQSSDFASALGGTFNNLAMIDLEHKRYREARANLEAAIVRQKKALAAYPKHPQYRKFLANHLTNLVQAADGLNDAGAAAQARRALEELSADDPRFAALDTRLGAILKGAAVKDNPERLALAQRASDTGRFAAAARLWREALEANPKLADDRKAQHRYRAACAAALAGSGKTNDDPAPDEAARGKLRKQARAWLDAELAIWTNLLASANPEDRAAIARSLEHWQTNTDLAGVREPKAIEALPEAERTGWRTLWQSVANTLARAESGSAK